MSLQIYPLQPNFIKELSQNAFSASLSIWQGNSLQLPAAGTHFGFVYQGQPLLSRQNGEASYSLRRGMYFCLPEAGGVGGEHSAGMVITRPDCHGMFQLGGPLEAAGRFAYIDGGTNSLLIPPVTLGDPCLNAIYFPPGVDQTLHTHPSDRIGMVVSGSGMLETSKTPVSLKPGNVFLIPANLAHKFITGDDSLTMVVFHPDSDAGFTHRDNPMLKRTVVNGTSAADLPQIQTTVERISTGKDVMQW